MDKALSLKRRIVLSLTVLTLATCMSLIVAEALLRVINPKMNYSYIPQQIYISHFKPSDLIPSELRPNNRSRFKMLEFDTTVITNSYGLRDNEVDFSKPRILCMGDSFTFGFGVENDEAFCAVLERLFQGKYDFLNGGFAGGFAPDTYALWLSKHLDSLSPQGIVVCLFQNDFSEVSANVWIKNGKVMQPDEPGLPDQITKPGFIITEDGTGIRAGPIAKLPPSIRRLIKRSYLIAFLRDRLLQDIEWSVWAYKAKGTTSNQDQKFVRSLELLKTVTGDRLLAFYLIPGNDQQLTPSHMDHVVMQFATKHGVPVLSNYGDFSKTDFFPLDNHFTKEGNVKAARYLHQALTKLSL